MIDKLAGIPAQIRALEKRLKEIDASKAKPAVIKEITDTIQNLKTLLKEKMEKKEQRKKDKELASKEVEKEAISVPNAANIGAVAPNTIAPTNAPGSPEATPSSADDNKVSCPLCGGMTFNDQAAYQQHMEFTHASDIMPTVPGQKLEKTVAAVDPAVVNKVETDPKIAPAVTIPDSLKKHDEIVDKVEKDPKVAPHIISEQEPTAELQKFSIDDKVEPIRGASGSWGQVMRPSGINGDPLVYVKWMEGPIKEKHGEYGGYYKTDLRKKVEEKPVEAAMSAPEPVCQKCIDTQDKHGDLKGNYEVLIKDLQDEYDIHYTQGNNAWATRLEQKIKDLKEKMSEKFSEQKEADIDMIKSPECKQNKHKDCRNMICQCPHHFDGTKKVAVGGPRLIRQIHRATSGHGYEATEYDLANGQFKQNVPLKINETKVRMTDPTSTQFEVKYDGMDWRMVAPQEFEQWLEQWKEINQKNNQKEGATERVVRDPWPAGVGGQVKHKPGVCKYCGWYYPGILGHCTNCGNSNPTSKQAAAENAEELTIMDHTPPRANSGPDAGGKDSHDEFQDEWAMPAGIEMVSAKGAPNTLFNYETAPVVAARLNSEINAPYKNATVATLGGRDYASVLLTVSADPKDQWPNGILHNSRYGTFHIDSSGEVEHYSGSFNRLNEPRRNFRKRNVKSVDQLIQVINQHLDAVNADVAATQKQSSLNDSTPIKLNVFNRELTATPTKEGYDISSEGKKLFNIKGKDSKPMNKKQLEFCAQIELTRGMKQAKLVEKIAFLEAGSKVYIVATDATRKRVKFASMDQGLRGWAPASKFASLTKEGEMRKHNDHIDNTFGHNGKEILVDCPNGSGNMVWLPMGKLLPINPPPATPESLNDTESSDNSEDCTNCMHPVGSHDDVNCKECGKSCAYSPIETESAKIVGPSNGKCPNWDYHHIGQKCETCGLDERDIKRNPKEKKAFNEYTKCSKCKHAKGEHGNDGACVKCEKACKYELMKDIEAAKECVDCHGHFEGKEGETCPTCGRFAVQKTAAGETMATKCRCMHLYKDHMDNDECSFESCDCKEFKKSSSNNKTAAPLKKDPLLTEFETKYPAYNGFKFDYQYPGYYAYSNSDHSKTVYFTPDFNNEGIVDVQVSGATGDVLDTQDVPYQTPLTADQLFAIVKPFLDKQGTKKQALETQLPKAILPQRGDVNTVDPVNGPSDEDVQQKAYEMFKQHWDALGSNEQDMVYKALGVTSSLNKFAIVHHEKDGWHVRSEEGKNLGGPYGSKEEAVKRLRQVEYFKHHKGSLKPFSKKAEVLVDPYVTLTTHINDMRSRMTQVQDKIQSIPAIKTAGDAAPEMDLAALFADLTQGIELLETKLGGDDIEPELHKGVEELENKLWTLEEKLGLTPKLSEHEKEEPEHKEIVEDIEKEAASKSNEFKQAVEWLEGFIGADIEERKRYGKVDLVEAVEEAYADSVGMWPFRSDDDQFWGDAAEVACKYLNVPCPGASNKRADLMSCVMCGKKSEPGFTGDKTCSEKCQINLRNKELDEELGKKADQVTDETIVTNDPNAVLPTDQVTTTPGYKNVQPTDNDNLAIPVVKPTSPPAPGQIWVFDTENNVYVSMPDPANPGKTI